MSPITPARLANAHFTFLCHYHCDANFYEPIRKVLEADDAFRAKQQQASASDGEPTLPGMERLANPQTEKVAT